MPSNLATQKHERLKLCVISICFLWCTSLYIAQITVSLFVPTPTSHSVVENIQGLYNATTDEATIYEMCMKDKETTCTSESEKAYQDENVKTTAKFQANEEYLNSFESLVKKCETEELYVYSFLESYQQYSPLSKIMNPNPPAECINIQTLINSETAGRNTMAQTSTFVESTGRQLNDMVGLYRDRQTFDEKFVSDQKAILVEQSKTLLDQSVTLNASLGMMRNEYQRLIDCMDPEKQTGCNFNPNAMKEFNDRVIKTYTDLHNQFSSKVHVIRTDLDEFHRQYNSFTDKLAVKFIVWIADPPNFDLDAIMNKIGELPMVKSMEESFKLQQTESRRLINEDMRRVQVQLDTISKHQAKQTSDGNSQSSATLEAFGSTYIPPSDVAHIVGVKDNIMKESQVFTSDLANTVGELGDMSGPDAVTSTFGSFNITSIANRTNTSPNIAFSSPTDWFIYIYDEFHLEVFMASWKSISSLAVLLDTLLRVMLSVQRILKYTKVSKTLAPPVDLRDKGTNESKQALNIPQKLAIYAFHPFAIAFLGFVFSCMVMSAFLTLYLPFFNKWADGCVATDQHSNGTFVTENVRTMGLQYASKDGNRIALEASNELELLNEQRCTDGLNLADQKFRDSEFRFQVLANQLESRHVQLETINTCLNLRLVSTELKLKTVESVCHERGLTLVQPGYDCSNFGKCSFTCTPPNEEMFRYWAWKAGCQGEWAVHGNLVGWILAFVVYTLFNISRVLAVKGIRFLNVDIFMSTKITCKVSLDVENMVVPKNFEHEAAIKLNQQVKKIKLKGRIYCAISALLLLLGLLLLLEVSKMFPQ